MGSTGPFLTILRTSSPTAPAPAVRQQEAVRASTARALVPPLVVLGLVGVVAVAATGSTIRGTNRARPPARALLDVVLGIELLAIAIGAVILAYGLWHRKEIAREMASGRYRRPSLVAWILLAVALTLLIRLRLNTLKPGASQPELPGNVPTGTPPGGALETPSTYEPRLLWVSVVVAVGLAAAAVAAYAMSARRRRPPPEEHGGLAEELAAVLDDTLDDLRRESDPRRAVVAAYARLERALAANGLPRGRSETEEELLERMLRVLEVSAPSARRLTRLFERARFSPHVIDAEMKEEAIGALEQVRDELRGSAATGATAVPAPMAGGAR